MRQFLGFRKTFGIFLFRIQLIRIETPNFEGKHVREICLDTETTGMAAKEGDRIIEIGCVELGEHGLTDQKFS